MKKDFRPVSVPLITVDPYFSIWSFSDELTREVTRHWTGTRNAMTGIIKIDGKAFICMGNMVYSNKDYCEGFPYIKQTNLDVTPTSTIYTFENALLKLTLTFTTPLLLDDLALASRPVSYIRYLAEPKTEGEHDIEFYFDIGTDACIDSDRQRVKFGRTEYSMFCGNIDQRPLNRSGDGVRIDWGYLHLCKTDAFIGNFSNRRAFCREGGFIDYFSEDVTYGLNAALAVICKGASDTIAVAYDDIHSINYYGDIIDAYYKEAYGSFDAAAKAALADADEVFAKCEKFDREFTKKMLTYGEDYANVGALAYRQAIAAHKICRGKNGEVLFFSKECYSNGCIATLDVTYPSIPLFLMLNPELVKGMLRPIVREATSARWTYPYAPHDCGQYPLATGQVYSARHGMLSEDEQMPVEECGNFILTVAAICRAEGSAAFAEENRELMEKWAEYLIEYGYNPENQLCTDDFAGHFAHNCNLSLKAIAALAAYGKLTGNTRYTDIAQDMARRFETEAMDEKATRLAFDREGTWSLKYNLVWDKLLGLGLFFDEFYAREIALYAEKMKEYCVPLDNRKMYTKLDWEAWTTVLTDNEEYRNKIYSCIAKMVSDTQQRVPITDWYDTETSFQVGFQNRTVLGGFYINMLKDMWENQ
ncbi:MAG: DUF4965 domain-containing protein [Clostridia bacterium]|nr:DUF4965 domain-containing protein [Clostridia bacterium]